mmetsp:Transcript_7843/g.19938  ORF Transcript_7843/g.19938 Transcript_7843/m.19938 type:complete len:242 (-) Transcript_7843:83-808(-)
MILSKKRLSTSRLHFTSPLHVPTSHLHFTSPLLDAFPPQLTLLISNDQHVPTTLHVSTPRCIAKGTSQSLSLHFTSPLFDALPKVHPKVSLPSTFTSLRHCSMRSPLDDVSTALHVSPPLLDALPQLVRGLQHGLVQRAAAEGVRVVAQQVALDGLAVHHLAGPRQQHRVVHHRLQDGVDELLRYVPRVLALPLQLDGGARRLDAGQELAQAPQPLQRRVRGEVLVPLEVAQEVQLRQVAV